jgi:hypothetical protein
VANVFDPLRTIQLAQMSTIPHIDVSKLIHQIVGKDPGSKANSWSYEEAI